MQSLMSDVEQPKLPYDEVAAREIDGGNLRLYTMNGELTAGIKQLASEQGTTLYVTMLAGFKIWLSLLSGQEEITLCSPISGRSHPDLEGVLGTMVNPVAMRTDLVGNPSGLQVLERVKQTALGAYANQDYPFDLLLQDLRQRRGSARSLYTVVFVGQNAHTDEMEFASGVQIRSISMKELLGELGAHFSDYVQNKVAEDPTVQLDLHVDVFDKGEQLVLHARYNPLRFHASTVDQFLAQYEAVLKQVVTDPQARLSQLELEDGNGLDDLLDDLF
jgi:non-ribosomal peptide synthetase component F